MFPATENEVRDPDRRSGDRRPRVPVPWGDSARGDVAIDPFSLSKTTASVPERPVTDL